MIGEGVRALYGFPSGSHQFRRLIDALADRHRVVAPDYPGFGHTEAPPSFTYTFDRVADTLACFVELLGLKRFAIYMFDFGAPVGIRLATRHPGRCPATASTTARVHESDAIA